MRKSIICIFPVLLLFFLFACKKESDNSYAVTSYSDYVNIHVGKTWIYRLDSTVQLSYGTDTTTHTYLQKDSIVDSLRDAAGQLSYRVYSYQKSFTDATDNWRYVTAYTLTPLADKLEAIAGDLRYIKLITPVEEAKTWDGNAYFLKDADGQISSDSSLYYYQGWNYTYHNVNGPVSLKTGNFDSTLTVSHINSLSGNTGSFDPALFQETIYSEEIYGKGTGLIYKKQLFLTWQPSGTSIGYQSGNFGIELSLMESR